MYCRTTMHTMEELLAAAQSSSPPLLLYFSSTVKPFRFNGFEPLHHRNHRNRTRAPSACSLHRSAFTPITSSHSITNPSPRRPEAKL